MSKLANDLESFFSSIRMYSTEEYDDTVKAVAKVLNCHYYGTDSETKHMLVVGSVGRGTAVLDTSDLDLLYDLPYAEYSRFDSYKNNGQSALLQDVKDALLEHWPRTEVKGDGQAVVIVFTDRQFTIDLVPAFKQTDGSFKYPDSNNGGSWKKTDPIPEQEECDRDIRRSDDNFLRLCNALRVWKDEQGFKFGGLLIDTLVHNFFKKETGYESFDINAGYDMLVDMFEWLSNQDQEQNYWLALGSNQQVHNKGEDAFVLRANKAQKALSDADGDDERRDVLESLLGKRFKNVSSSLSKSGSDEARWSKQYGYTPNEKFVEDRFQVSIRSSVTIDCKVTQQGFRPMMLSEMLHRNIPLLRMKTLDFHIVETDATKPYEIYWKVRNCGRVAFEKHMVRGQLLKDAGCHAKIEKTLFVGPHYVECYVIKNGVCVARDRIDVPIRES